MEGSLTSEACAIVVWVQNNICDQHQRKNNTKEIKNEIKKEIKKKEKKEEKKEQK